MGGLKLPFSTSVSGWFIEIVFRNQSYVFLFPWAMIKTRIVYTPPQVCVV